MIEAQYYYNIYLILVTILTVISAESYVKKPISGCNLQSSVIVTDHGALFLAIILAIFIGLRPLSGYYFGDTSNYARTYYLLEGLSFKFNPLAPNKIWDNLFSWWASKRLGISNLFVLADIINFVCTFLACRKLFNKDQYIAFLVFLGSFSTFSYATNGVKAGVAAAIFLLGISYNKKLIISIPLILISWGFHHSMTLPVAACIMSFLYKNTKFYYGVWIICLLLSAAHITFFQTLFAQMAEDQGDLSGVGYLTLSPDDEWGGKSGFRFDFVLYSAMPLLVNYIAIFKKKLQISNYYKFILNIYIITNAVWMLCMYANFTNRIAYLSWFMFPVTLIYPFLKENWGNDKYKTLSKVVLANLGFTLFMHIIYINKLSIPHFIIR